MRRPTPRPSLCASGTTPMATTFISFPDSFWNFPCSAAARRRFASPPAPLGPARLETTVRRTGQLTDQLHQLGNGDEVGIRGPFGNGFDVQAARGKDMLFVAGGIGLPPLRSLIWNVLDERDRFGKVTILYGARTPEDLVYKDELEEWGKRSDVELLVTVDVATHRLDGKCGGGPHPVPEGHPAPGIHSCICLRPAHYD